MRALLRPSSLRIACVALLFACAKTGDRTSSRTDSLRDSNTANASATVVARDTNIVVNGVALTDDVKRQLHQLYPVEIAPGRYWYDAISGAWGREGEPIAGQMIAGLALGGALAGDASRGTSGVFINGRQLTVGEKSYIERLCQAPVVTARYWVLSNGVGGYEGGPAYFNLGQCPGVPHSGGGHSPSDTYCDASGACTTSGILGTITTARM